MARQALSGQTVVVAGASGLVGSWLLPHLIERGAHVVALSRDPTEHAWPDGTEAIAWGSPGDGPLPLPDGTRAVVNLAGASIGGRRWAAAYKKTLRESRLRVTQGVVDALEAAPADHRPAVLVQASGVGYYGIRPEGKQLEDRPPGDDFLGTLCADWEAAAAPAPCRTVRFRFGHILDAGEGILGRLLPLYKARLAGPLGSGRQGLPWVHAQDVARAIAWAIENDAAEGPYNLAAPERVDQRTFKDELAATLDVFAKWPIPGFALRIVAGPIAPHLLGGQWAPPERLEGAGFQFEHETLDEALRDLLTSGRA